MNDIAYSTLDSAGWYLNRSINVDFEIEILQKEGFTPPNESIVSMLKEFWNLRLEFTLPDGSFSDIELNIEAAIDNIDVETMAIHERFLNKKIIPVGLLHFRTALLLVSWDLNFYMATNGEIYMLADSFDGFLDVTINRKEIFKLG